MSDASQPITLKTPIGTGDKAIKEITLRKPAPGEMRGLQLGQLAIGDVGQLTKLLPRISTPAISEADVAGMEFEDFAACYEKISGFFGK